LIANRKRLMLSNLVIWPRFSSFKPSESIQAQRDPMIDQGIISRSFITFLGSFRHIGGWNFKGNGKQPESRPLAGHSG
jgi:hypothetical protein